MASQDQEHFRDSIGTINEEGKRSWVYPKKPVGKLYEYRKLCLLYTSPSPRD